MEGGWVWDGKKKGKGKSGEGRKTIIEITPFTKTGGQEDKEKENTGDIFLVKIDIYSHCQFTENGGHAKEDMAVWHAQTVSLSYTNREKERTKRDM